MHATTQQALRRLFDAAHDHATNLRAIAKDTPGLQGDDTAELNATADVIDADTATVRAWLDGHTTDTADPATTVPHTATLEAPRDPLIAELAQLIARLATDGYVVEPSEFDLAEFYVGKGEPDIKLTWPLPDT